MRITVLGSKGMLGHVVARVLAEAGHEVRNEATRYDPAAPRGFIEAVLAGRPEAVVNCIGVRPGPGIADGWIRSVNATLPALVAEAVAGRCRFVHASSDGVFGPHKAARRVEETGDATDLYGRSKWEAESAVRAAGGTVIRASIIGPELGEPRSLMGWFLARHGPVRGFTDHAWNGITTLEWARLCARSLDRPGTGGIVCQPGFWPPVSKAEVLRLIGEIWRSAATVQPVEAPSPVLRSLVPDVTCPPLRRQLLELKAWYGR